MRNCIDDMYDLHIKPIANNKLKFERKYLLNPIKKSKLEVNWGVGGSHAPSTSICFFQKKKLNEMNSTI